MTENDDALRDTRARGRRRLLVVAAIFVGPFFVAMLLHGFGWQPGGQVNRGVLLTPAVPLPAFELSAPAVFAPVAGTWQVLIVSRDGCSSACQRALDDTRRVLDLLGHDRDRVQRVVVGMKGVNAAAVASDTDLIALDASAAANAGVLAAFSDAADGAVYVADPRRNLILRYAPGQDAKDLLDDLKRLLKYSG